MREFDRRRLFECQGKRSRVIRDVLPKEARVRKNFVQPVYSEGPNTLFPDVSIVPFDETVTPEEEALFRLPAATLQETQAQFFARLFDAICYHIEDQWLPGKVHILFHSSGWDSRIMGTALKWVIDRKGYTDPVVLFSFGPEAKEARRIMLHEGWDEQQIVTVEDPALWLWPILDISCGRWLNGAHPTIPASRYWLLETCRRALCIPANKAKLQYIGGYGSTAWSGAGAELSIEEMQDVSGFGSDYWLKGAGINRLRRWATKHYGVATSIPLAVPHEILPWLAHDVLRVVVESSVRGGFELRADMCAWLDPALARFERVCDDWPPFPPAVMLEMRDQYRASWYGKNCAPGAVPADHAMWSAGHGHPLERSDWWSHWTAACYCEWLRKDGYTLK
jgi:hypothetical protein